MVGGEDWVEGVNRSLVGTIMRLGLGLLRRKRWLTTCPACGQTTRGSTDERAPVTLFYGPRGEGRWRCHRVACGARGDALALLAYVAVGELPESGSPRWREVRDLAARIGLCSAEDGDRPALKASTAPASIWESRRKKAKQ